MTDVTHFIVSRDALVRDCVARFAETHAGIVLFVDDQGRFVGLLTGVHVGQSSAMGLIPLHRLDAHVPMARLRVD